MKALLAVLNQLVFNLTLATVLISLYVSAFLVSWLPTTPTTAEYPKVDYRESFMLLLCRLGFSLCVLVCRPFCQVKVSQQPGTLQLLSQLAKNRTAFYVIGNHCSFYDVLSFSAHCPWDAAMVLRTLAKEQLFRLPLLGKVLRTVGHLPVKYTHSTDQVKHFSVDNGDELHESVERLLAHGHSVCMFPEGHMNREDSRVIKPFRYGGLKPTVVHDLPVFGNLQLNNEIFWGPTQKCGGVPVDTYMFWMSLCPQGTWEYLRQNAKDENIRKDPGKDIDASTRELAVLLRDEMQTALSEFKKA